MEVEFTLRETDEAIMRVWKIFEAALKRTDFDTADQAARVYLFLREARRHTTE